ncbi:hypothetical protein HN784_03660 [bacterium]|jgi:hypothetical protein|nr:hypothetical protein [bacterium]MBT4251092.1 hypothetical protein [bacterium]MBT4598116.1 hypothetical protein [bacterium]MBT6753458.1 hypothetical protein [bacterium]MBT7038171.1 hypothetical protein [bacterium]
MERKVSAGLVKKISIILLDCLVNHRPILAMIGYINKYLLKGRIRSVFLVYPAKRRHITAYTFDWFSKRMQWKPFIIGFFIQKKGVGIVFTMSSGEKDFLKNENRSNLKLLFQRMEEKRMLLRAEIKSFAGVLPGVLYKKGISKKTQEADFTVTAIFRAIELLKEKEKLPHNHVVVILGAKGFIGKKLVTFLENKKEYREKIFGVDLDNLLELPKFLETKRNNHLIFLNITKKKALNEYIPFFTNKTIVLNEVYPEPSEEELAEIKAKRAKCYHVVGLKGRVYPRFPGAYDRGVPCCASFVSCNKNGIIIKKMI